MGCENNLLANTNNLSVNTNDLLVNTDNLSVNADDLSVNTDNLSVNTNDLCVNGDNLFFARVLYLKLQGTTLLTLIFVDCDRLINECHEKDADHCPAGGSFFLRQ